MDHGLPLLRNLDNRCGAKCDAEPSHDRVQDIAAIGADLAAPAEAKPRILDPAHIPVVQHKIRGSRVTRAPGR